MFDGSSIYSLELWSNLYADSQHARNDCGGRAAAAAASRICSRRVGSLGMRPTAFPLMIPALPARGKQCTTAVDRTPALRQHAEQLMSPGKRGNRGTQ
jgi:hypothetical protein